jgi:hypothetical protein
MNAQQFMQLLNDLGACKDARDWAKGKSWQEVYDTCHRGDWILWLYRKSKGYNFQKLTLAKALCANTVRHLMKDERSVKALNAAIAFGKGEISIDELYAAYAAAAAATPYAATADAAAAADAYAYAAAAADAAADADASAWAASAAAWAAAAAAAPYAAAAYAYAYAADADAYAAARKENQQKTADIVREVLPIEIWKF